MSPRIGPVRSVASVRRTPNLVRTPVVSTGRSAGRPIRESGQCAWGGLVRSRCAGPPRGRAPDTEGQGAPPDMRAPAPCPLRNGAEGPAGFPGRGVPIHGRQPEPTSGAGPAPPPSTSRASPGRWRGNEKAPGGIALGGRLIQRHNLTPTDNPAPTHAGGRLEASPSLATVCAVASRATPRVEGPAPPA